MNVVLLKFSTISKEVRYLISIEAGDDMIDVYSNSIDKRQHCGAWKEMCEYNSGERQRLQVRGSYFIRSYINK